MQTIGDRRYAIYSTIERVQHLFYVSPKSFPDMRPFVLTRRPFLQTCYRMLNHVQLEQTPHGLRCDGLRCGAQLVFPQLGIEGIQVSPAHAAENTSV